MLSLRSQWPEIGEEEIPPLKNDTLLPTIPALPTQKMREGNFALRFKERFVFQDAVLQVNPCFLDSVLHRFLCGRFDNVESKKGLRKGICGRVGRLLIYLCHDILFFVVCQLSVSADVSKKHAGGFVVWQAFFSFFLASRSESGQIVWRILSLSMHVQLPCVSLPFARRILERRGFFVRPRRFSFQSSSQTKTADKRISTVVSAKAKTPFHSSKRATDVQPNPCNHHCEKNHRYQNIHQNNHRVFRRHLIV